MQIKGWVWMGLAVVGLAGLTLADMALSRRSAWTAADRQLPLMPEVARVAGFRAFLAFGPVPALTAGGAETRLDAASAGEVAALACAREVSLRNLSGPGRLRPDWQAVVVQTCPFVVTTDAGPLRVLLHREDITGDSGPSPVLPLRPLAGEALHEAAARLAPVAP